MFVSPDTFSGLRLLRSIAWMFHFAIIPENIVVPSNLLYDCIQLQDISYMFYRAMFNSTASMTQQIDDNFFSRNTNLRNISYALASGQSAGDWTGRSPKKISSTLFNASKHRQLQNVTGLFYNATTTTGSVPEFWTWLGGLSSVNRSNVFYMMSKANITNSGSIPSEWSNGMRD
jgi:hypothetical protein